MWLANEIREHKVELTVDFRRFYPGCSIYQINREINVEEAYHLIQGLGSLSDGFYFAKKNGWEYPMSPEARILADIYDLNNALHNSKKNKKEYPRGFKKNKKQSFGGEGVPVEKAKTLFKSIREKMNISNKEK